jgi:3-oxoacyl-[acyl-carrier protein] reductase
VQLPEARAKESTTAEIGGIEVSRNCPLKFSLNYFSPETPIVLKLDKKRPWNIMPGSRWARGEERIQNPEYCLSRIGGNMDLKLTGKVALVTGAGSQIGYGKAIAVTLAQEGCAVAAVDINLEWAQQTATEINKAGGRAQAEQADVARRSEVDRMVETVIDTFGRIDILVNNAGASSKERPFLQMTSADWDKDINVNLIGQMNVAQAVIPQMAKQNYGRIINTSGGQGLPTISVYGAAKAGIEAWTHALALEVAPLGIIVNGVAPGLGKTGLTANMPEELMEANRQRSAFKRLCTPADVAPVVAFLASDVCSYMAGQWIRLSTF